MSQSLFDLTELRLVCYVDDPLAAIRGAPEDRKLKAAILIIVWAALGFKLAFAKGQMGKTVTWIGGALTIEATGVRAVVKQAIVDDILEDLKRIGSQNITSKKELRSLVGKLGHAAGLLIVMRPFLDPIWAAWAAPSPAGHPGCVWAKSKRRFIGSTLSSVARARK